MNRVAAPTSGLRRNMPSSLNISGDSLPKEHTSMSINAISKQGKVINTKDNNQNTESPAIKDKEKMQEIENWIKHQNEKSNMSQKQVQIQNQIQNKLKDKSQSRDNTNDNKADREQLIKEWGDEVTDIVVTSASSKRPVGSGYQMNRNRSLVYSSGTSKASSRQPSFVTCSEYSEDFESVSEIEM